MKLANIAIDYLIREIVMNKKTSWIFMEMKEMSSQHVWELRLLSEELT